MKAEEYFGDWIDVIDKQELRKVVTWINKTDSATLCPSPKNIFRAFRACPYEDCKVVFLGQDPYPQKLLEYYSVTPKILQRIGYLLRFK